MAQEVGRSVREDAAAFPSFETASLRNSIAAAWAPWKKRPLGVIGATVILLVAWMTGIAETITWVPPIFLSIIILGFCTWEGGFIGIQKPHMDFERFQDTLRSGKHVLLVDVRASQEHILQRVTGEHPKLTPAGEGHAAPGWFVSARDLFNQMIKGTAWRPH